MFSFFKLSIRVSKGITQNLTLVVRKFSPSIEPVINSPFKKEKYSDLLKNYGFNHGQISRIFNSPFAILHLPEKNLMSNLVCWLNFKVGDKLFTALCAYPELLTLSPDYINHQVQELMTLFTRADINKLLVTCPNVFLEDFQKTHDKVQYIVIRMGVEQKSIVKRQALRFTLEHIKCRHNFMVFAGCFKLNKKAVKSRNAPLHKIFSVNMETFLKLTKVTEEEYEVFANCFTDEIDCYKDFPEDEDSDEE